MPWGMSWGQHLKGLMDKPKEDDLIRLQSLIDPKKPTAIGPFDVDTPNSPYPFKQPPVMTKDLDDRLKMIRSIAPGAGTKATNISNIPDYEALATLNPLDAGPLLKGRA